MDFVAQGGAVDKLHGNEVETFGLSDFVNMSDVWMVERGGGFRFLNKTTHAVRICSEVSRKNLECDLAIEGYILGQINFPHTTRPQFRENFVLAEFPAGTNKQSPR